MTDKVEEWRSGGVVEWFVSIPPSPPPPHSSTYYTYHSLLIFLQLTGPPRHSLSIWLTAS